MSTRYVPRAAFGGTVHVSGSLRTVPAVNCWPPQYCCTTWLPAAS